MQATLRSGQRPIQVNVALVLWTIGAGLNLIEWALEADWRDWVTYPVFVILLMLSALLLWFIYRRQNWARWLVVGLVAFRTLLLLRAIHRTEDISLRQAASLGSRTLFQLAPAILLFSRPATTWFRGGQAGASSHP